MEDLLIKISEAVERKDTHTKCVLVTQVYEQVAAKIQKVDGDLNSAGLDVDIMAFDGELANLESICNELVKILNPELQKVLTFLKPRFEAHMYRHKKITWEQVEKRLRETDPKKLWSLNEMERTGGEPDVTGVDKKTGALIFQDRSPESPPGRRKCVYDKLGVENLKRDFPDGTFKGNAVDMAAKMGVELLDEKKYREAQKVDKLDENSCSWIKTPVDKRKEGVALSSSRLRDEVILYQDNPSMHTDTRAFRASLRV